MEIDLNSYYVLALNSHSLTALEYFISAVSTISHTLYARKLMNISECSGEKNLKEEEKGMRLLSLVTLTRSLNPTVVEPTKKRVDNKTHC
jgi:hypothetical protein